MDYNATKVEAIGNTGAPALYERGAIFLYFRYNSYNEYSLRIAHGT